VADVDTQVLSRLLKILELTVKGGEDIDSFASRRVPTLLARSSPKKPSTKKKTKYEKENQGEENRAKFPVIDAEK